MSASNLASSSSGRVPQGEVIIEFQDGGSFIKKELDQAVLDLERRRIMKEEGRKAMEAMQKLELEKAGAEIKKEDVAFIMDQLGLKESQAKAALLEEKGDLVKALIRLVKPTPRAS